MSCPGSSYERTREHTEYVFGDRITGLDDHAGGVTVAFDRGPDRTFDVVVVAEGLRSRTRGLVFPSGVQQRHLGVYIAYLTVPRTETDTRLVALVQRTAAGAPSPCGRTTSAPPGPP